MSGVCSVCGAAYAPFGYRPPSAEDYQWFCRDHRPQTIEDPSPELSLDLGRAKASRDEAMKRVIAHSWDWGVRMNGFIRYMVPAGAEVIGEDIRVQALKLCPEIGSASHHNAMGQVVKQAVEDGLLIDTGKMRHMKTEKSNARRSPLWRRTNKV